MSALTVESGLDEFIRMLPAWTDPRHQVLIAIAFASGAYTAASIAVDGDPEDAREQAHALCLWLQGELDVPTHVH